MEHAVHERGPFHHVAHEDEQGDREQRVVRHHAVGPLRDQVEHPVVVPVGARDPEGEVPEDHAEAHQGEGGRVAHHDRDHDQAQHDEAEGRVAHGRLSSSRTACSCTTLFLHHAPVARGLVDGLRALHGGPARLLVHVLAVAELGVDDVDLLDVLQARRPHPGAEADQAADDLGQPLQHDEHARDRDHRLEVVDRRPLRGDGGVLADAPGVEREAAPRVDEAEHARHEEQQVEREVQRGLAARLHVDVDEVGAHVARLGQGVGPAHHEQGAVQHVVEVEDPRGGGVQDVALEHLDGYHEGEGDDQPGKRLARPVADLVDGADEALRAHREGGPDAKQAGHPAGAG